jgi:hypothetical protein
MEHGAWSMEHGAVHPKTVAIVTATGRLARMMSEETKKRKRRTWEEGFQDLKAFFEENGHC